ncbi:ATP-binding protein [Enterococcus faecalis]|uniref:ATP-binding protein n=1 Tax=Enterococcus faecalis TaxID=1351 RepID=UPI00036BCCE9|nr:ATP-binding protein [Enterococcus faecalis]EPH85026.1 hypothetical protein D924_01227 [Enterococcus faecalis 06-MB-S-10]EPH92735.1 hypothetical protein D923_00009 [Enterococcus faecalis 06-MB-S-04]
MMINDFYSEVDKNNFYLGMITQVYKANIILQVENLSLLSHRELRDESLVPNTINYYVIIDSIQGLFFGEIYQSKLSNSDNIHITNKEKLLPEMGIEILGILTNGNKNFNLSGNLTAGVTDKVYIANKKVIKKYFDSIELKKTDEDKLSCFSILSNNEQDIQFKPSTLFDNHLMTIGTTNSGKSTSSLSILDKLIKDNIKVLIIDPTGEYSDSFTKKEIKKLKLGIDTAISVGELSMQHWAMLFETNDSTQPAVLSGAIQSLRYQHMINSDKCYTKVGKKVVDVEQELIKAQNHKDFDLNKLSQQIAIETIEQSKDGKYQKPFNINANQYLVQKIDYKLQNTTFTDFFNSDKEYSLIKEIEHFSKDVNGSLYIDSSLIGISDGIGGMIIDLISKFIINLPKEHIKPFVLFIDEVHRYTKNHSLTDSNYYSGLTNIAREGRKKGIFLFLTTQNPNNVDNILLGQVGTLLIHRLTQSNEIKAIQNHLNTQEISQIKKLNTGEAILTSVNLLKDVNLKIKACPRSHNNETPNLRINSK